MPAAKQQLDRIRFAVAAKIQDLKPEQRFNLLKKLMVKYTSDMAVTLARKLTESDEKIENLSLSPSEIRDVLEGRMEYPLSLQTLSGNTAEWASETKMFIKEIEKMAQISFDTHVRAHITAMTEGLDGLAKLSAFARQENFPLFTTINAQYQVRLAVTTSLEPRVSLLLDHTMEHAAEYQYYLVRMREVACFHERFIRMKHFDRFDVNDVHNQIASALGALPASDGVFLVTPIIARIAALENKNFDGLPELNDMNRTIPNKEWIVSYLEEFGKKDSRALAEERNYLEDLVVLKDRYVGAIGSLLEEHKAMVGALPGSSEAGEDSEVHMEE